MAAGFRSALFILGISSPPFAPFVGTSGHVLVKDTTLDRGAEWRHALPSVVTLNASSVSFVAPVSVAEFRDVNPYYRSVAVLTGAGWARLVVNVKTGVAGHSAAVQYSTDSGSTWDYLDGGTGPTVDCGATGFQVSTWVAIDALATGTCWLRLVTGGGDGVTTVNWYNVAVEFSYVEA